MAKVPLKNVSPLGYMKTVEEASKTVSKWPEWKRERLLFSSEGSTEISGTTEKPKENRKSASA
jgi:hypothetical protein